MKKTIFTVILIFISFSLYAQNKIWVLGNLADDAYNNFTSCQLPMGFVREKTFQGNDGFQVAKYGNSRYVIIAYRGTDEARDGLVDFEMYLPVLDTHLRSQIYQAEYFYLSSIESESREIIIIGHSLGGYLAQIIGYKYGKETHTFNAPGAYTIVDEYHLTGLSGTGRIVNHISLEPVSVLGVHIGRIDWCNHYSHGISSFWSYLQSINY